MSDIKVLVLGGGGMLGHKVFQTLLDDFPTIRCTFHDSAPPDPTMFPPARIIENIDAMDLAGLRARLRECRPDVVVNCVGVIKQRDAATMAIPSITLNSLLPHELAAWLREWDGRLIHFSTDCVFSGRKGNYVEADLSDAEDLYGRTKFLGETPNTKNALTIRTSIIGRELSHFQSLLEWLLSQNHKSIKGFRHGLWSGVTTNWLARTIGILIAEHRNLSGLFQVTSSTVSKYDLLTMLRDAYRLDITIEPDDAFFCDRSMVGAKFERATAIVCPPWPALIDDLIADKTPYGKHPT